MGPTNPRALEEFFRPWKTPVPVPLSAFDVEFPVELAPELATGEAAAGAAGVAVLFVPGAGFPPKAAVPFLNSKKENIIYYKRIFTSISTQHI